jgi:hypothetical protein
VTVIIGVDPHTSTQTAVAIDRDERPLARLRLVADRCQTPRLLAWAEPLGSERTGAVESAGGLGKLLAQRLLEAGEHVDRCAPDAGGEGAAAGLDQGVQERPPRRAGHRWGRPPRFMARRGVVADP